MRTITLISLIAGCVLTCGPAYASAGNPAPQQSTGPTTAASDRSSNAEHATAGDGSMNHVETAASDVQRHAPDRKHPRSRTALPKTTNSKHVQRHQRSVPQDVRNMQRAVPKKPGNTGRKAVNSHTATVRPATGFALSGQDFRNNRNRNEAHAVIGGPTRPKTNTAAINGTGMNRKRLN